MIIMDVFSIKMTVPAGATNNVVDNENNYLYNDGHDCFFLSSSSKTVRLFLIANNVWVVGNQSDCNVDVEIMVIKKNEKIRVVNIEQLNPNDTMELSFSTNEWYCYCLESNQMYLKRINDMWHVKSVGHKPVYNNKVIAFKRS